MSLLSSRVRFLKVLAPVSSSWRCVICQSCLLLCFVSTYIIINIHKYIFSVLLGRTILSSSLSSLLQLRLSLLSFLYVFPSFFHRLKSNYFTLPGSTVISIYLFSCYSCVYNFSLLLCCFYSEPFWHCASWWHSSVDYFRSLYFTSFLFLLGYFLKFILLLSYFFSISLLYFLIHLETS